MEIDIKQILLQVFNFGILFFILAKFLFRPILKILDERSRKIAEGLALTEKNKDAEARIEKKSAEVLGKAERQAAKIIEEARRESKELGKALVAEAKAEAEKVVVREQSAFIERMADEERQFKARVSDLVATTTSRVLADSLTGAEIKKITKKEVAKLKTLK